MQILKDKLLNLITDYIKCSAYLYSVLKSNFPLDNEGILRSRRLNLIPKEGRIENVYFSFHGGGCYFELENDIIDIDFGPNDRTDGFDLMRLTQFVKMRLNEYNEFADNNILKREFDFLIAEKIIINPKFYPNPHLFYFSNSIKE